MISELEADAQAPDSLGQRILRGIAVARFCAKGGDLLSKVLIFVVQFFFMMSLTFYAAANSAYVIGVASGTPSGGIMFLYALTIGSAWVIFLVLLKLVEERNVVVAGKLPLILLIVCLLALIFFAVFIASIVHASNAAVGGGTLIGYFILTWLVTELIQIIAVVIQFKCGKKTQRNLLQADDVEDEHAENRGTFTGVDEFVAVGEHSKATTEGMTDTADDNNDFMTGIGQEAEENDQAEDADLGLL